MFLSCFENFDTFEHKLDFKKIPFSEQNIFSNCGCALIFVSYIVDFYWSLFFKLWIFIDFGFLHCVFSLIFVSYIVGFHWSLFLTLWIFIDLCLLHWGFSLICVSYMWIFIELCFLNSWFSLIFVSYNVDFHWSLFPKLGIFNDLCFLNWEFSLWIFIDIYFNNTLLSNFSLKPRQPYKLIVKRAYTS